MAAAAGDSDAEAAAPEEAAAPAEKAPRKPRARKRKPASGTDDEAGSLNPLQRWQTSSCCVDSWQHMLMQ